MQVQDRRSWPPEASVVLLVVMPCKPRLATGHQVRYLHAMASPARKPLAGTEHPDEALEILRRLEPVLSKLDERTRVIEERVKSLDERTRLIETEQHRQADVLVRLDDRQRKQGEDISELKGRLGELLARVPSVWTIAAMILSLFSAAFVLIRFAGSHG